MAILNETALAGDPVAAHQSPFEAEIARLIVASLQLELDARDIVTNAPLFHEGLGLDSIDALELSLAISRGYGVDLKSDDPAIREIFASLRSLSAHVMARRTR